MPCMQRNRDASNAWKGIQHVWDYFKQNLISELETRWWEVCEVLEGPLASRCPLSLRFCSCGCERRAHKIFETKFLKLVFWIFQCFLADVAGTKSLGINYRVINGVAWPLLFGAVQHLMAHPQPYLYLKEL